MTLCPSLIRLTASSLNSIVYACFGIFISCLPNEPLAKLPTDKCGAAPLASLKPFFDGET
jgi:hypothetical protein